MKTSILIVDDDKQFVKELVFMLDNDFSCFTAYDSNEALAKIKSVQPDIVLLDLMLGDESGINLLKQIKLIEDDLPIIMITEYASVNTAVDAMRSGAEDYISKTPNLGELKILVERALKKKIDKLKEQTLNEEIKKGFSRIVGSSKAVQEIKSKIDLIAKTNNTVLITGESGTGKELIARSVHEKSSRRNEIFVAVNCPALPDNLIESELFGHEQGAFTGAIKKKLGKFEIATQGTIFLDEIGDLKPNVQVKLMRVLQEKEFERVGGNKQIFTNARVIAATNQPLDELVKSGEFRKDLYYRLDVFPIHAEPLRNRKEDIPELVDYFASSISRELNVKNPGFSEESMECLIEYDWHGNIRELINYITRTIILCGGKTITPELLHHTLFGQIKEKFTVKDIPLKWEEMDKMRKEAAAQASRDIEAEFAKRLLKKFDGGVSKAADYAGMDRTNLHRIIKRCGL